MPAKKSNKLDRDISIINATDNFNDLDEFKSQLRKEFGGNTALDDEDFVRSFIPTGIDSLDFLLGGGLIQGAMAEISGKEGSGKSSFGIHMLAQVQKLGGLACLIDTEGGSGDRFRMENFGVDTKKCIITVEDLAERAFAQIEKIANYIQRKNISVPSLVVLDSLAGLSTRAELESDYETSTVAMTAKMISKGLKRTKMLCRETNLAVLIINQVRQQIGGMTSSWQGPVYTTVGGDAVRYACISRLFMDRGKFIGSDPKLPSGHFVRTKIIKCKSSAALGRTIPLRLYYDDRGYYNPHIVYDLLNDADYMGKAAWKTIIMPDGSEKKFNSIDTFTKLFNESEENKQHFLKMMRNCYSEKLNFSAGSEEAILPDASDIRDIADLSGIDD
jgi:recombination protein RecA